MAETRLGRPLLVCADDYGQSPGIDEAIAALVGSGRLGAFSCLSNAPHWQQAARHVPGLRRRASAGLHLNLTEGRPLSPALARHWPQLPALPKLLWVALIGKLPRDAVGEELDAQWDAFVEATGAAPDHLDGHQHVHQLPGVRDWVLARALPTGLPVRSTASVPGPGPALKRWVIQSSGGRALGRELQQAGLPHHPVLLGVYDFVESDYRRLMRAWLAQVPAQGAMLFCHPAVASDGAAADAIAAARLREHTYLAGADFTRDLAGAGVTLVSAWPQPAFSRMSSGG